jgi:hypothetical protein
LISRERVSTLARLLAGQSGCWDTARWAERPPDCSKRMACASSLPTRADRGQSTKGTLSPVRGIKKVRRQLPFAQPAYTNPRTGSIPEAFYSTKDPQSLEAFLKETDVLVASLPGTPQTQYLLDAEKLGKPAQVAGRA